MKLIKLKIFILANLTLLAISAKAQLKVGNNPTIIGATSNLEIESSSGKKIVANKTTGGLSIDYTPSAASTDSVLLKNTPTGEIRQMSFARFKALYGGGSSSVSGACPGLGYTPNETAPTAPSSISVTPTINGTKAATTFAYNGHTYALYNLSGGVTWAQAQTAARNVGGYLAVITTANEWAYIYGLYWRTLSYLVQVIFGLGIESTIPQATQQPSIGLTAKVWSITRPLFLFGQVVLPLASQTMQGVQRGVYILWLLV